MTQYPPTKTPFEIVLELSQRVADLERQVRLLGDRLLTPKGEAQHSEALQPAQPKISDPVPVRIDYVCRSCGYHQTLHPLSELKCQSCESTNLNPIGVI